MVTAGGRSLVFFGDRGGEGGIWRSDLDGVTNPADMTIVRFVLSPDGRTLVLSRGTTLRDAFLLTGFR